MQKKLPTLVVTLFRKLVLFDEKENYLICARSGNEDTCPRSLP